MSLTFDALFNRKEGKESTVSFYITKCCSGRTLKSFKNWGPFLALVLFIFASGGIFYSIEQKHCSQETQAPVLNGTKSSDVKEQNGLISYWSAVHFVATTITTIGYGDIVPCSPLGQFLAICFSVIGIPLMLFCLAQLGKFFEHFLNRAWHRMKYGKVFDYRKAYTDDVPLSIGLAVTFAWILLSSIYFYFTLLPIYRNRDNKSDANFTYFTACYFSLITFLTIGYGDVSPINHEIVISTYLFIFVGLALVTMCIDIMQTKLENLFDNMVRIIQNEYKKSVEGKSTMATDADDIKKNVKSLLISTGDGKLFGPILNKRQKERLIEEYKKQANMVNKDVQATVEMIERITNTQILDKKEVACQTTGLNWLKKPLKMK